MIPRAIASTLKRSAEYFPVVTLFGPRQSGKTTLVTELFPDHLYLNFENPETRALFREDPRGLLRNGTAPLIVDEAHRIPDVLSWIQIFADEANEKGRFVITGSNQPLLGEAVSQSLAGRTAVHHLLPLSLQELRHYGVDIVRDDMLLRGCMPRIHAENVPPGILYPAYFETYLERDVRNLIHLRDRAKFETFVRLLAGRVGQLVNLSSLAGDIGVSSTTLSGWLSVLEASFVVFRVTPYHANIGKRLVKTPKIYFSEPGLVAYLLQIETASQMSRDPLLGSLFENLVVVEVLKQIRNRALAATLSFYRDKSGTEIDLVYERGRRPFLMEIKAGATFLSEMGGSIHAVAPLLKDVAGSAIVYAGQTRDDLSDPAVWNFAGVADRLPVADAEP
jgi:predicted AAA+ superfamily ATPase